MFILKLNSGATLMVDGVEERYNNNRSSGSQNSVNLRINTTTTSLEALRSVLEADAALDKIVVTDDTGMETMFTGYNNLQSINRTLVPGGANIQITLTPVTVVED